MKKKISNKILYLSFHNSIKKKFGVNRFVTKKELMIKLGRQFLVPKNLRKVALKELENMKLIEKEDEKYFKILDFDLDLEKDVNKFYQNIGFFCFF